MIRCDQSVLEEVKGEEEEERIGYKETYHRRLLLPWPRFQKWLAGLHDRDFFTQVHKAVAAMNTIAIDSSIPSHNSLIIVGARAKCH